MAAANPIPEPGDLSEQEAVETALREVGSVEEGVRGTGPGARLWFAPYLLAVVLFLAAGLLLDATVIDNTVFGTLLQKIALGAAVVVLVVGLVSTIERMVIGRLASVAARYHLRQALRLGAALLIGLTIVSLLSASWYTTLASLGLVSVILGLALQTPLTSFFGWIYIMIRAPYRIGDRIRLGDATGDVIKVGYLDTTLWEFGGPYLTTDHPSGRIIKFPNSKVLDSTVYNYSWPLFPFIWSETRFQMGYDSDLEFVAQQMQAVAEEEIGNEMMERVAMYRRLLAQTPIDHLTVQERPSVIFRPRDTWIEAVLRYVVHPKETGRVRSRLTQRVLARLNEHPDRVRFPLGNAR